MKKILSILAIGLTLSLIGCGSTTPAPTSPAPNPAVVAPAPTPAPAPAPKAPAKIGSWSGEGAKDTETFHLAGGQAKISYETTTGGNSMVFVVTVEDKDGNPVQVAASTQKAGKDVSYTHLPAGDYHLSINSFGTPWTILVEQ